MFPRTLTTLILTLAFTFGTQVLVQADASAGPGSTLAKSRASGTRTHKGRQASASTKSSTKSKKSKKKSSGTRRVVRSTAPAHRTTSHTTTSRPSTTRTTRTTHPSATRTTRTVRTSHPTTTHRSSRTVHHTRMRGQNVRRTYHSGRSSHSTHRSSHSHSRSSHSHTTHTSATARTGRTQRATTDAYVTGGLGFSGFASDAIVDGALPGIGYNLAVGAKGKLFGAELGLNGGGYTFDPGSASADIALIGLSGDLKLQPSIDFFEPYVALGIGGYAMQDGVINEASTGVGVRLGAGADFRFDNIALRVSYLYGAYGMGNDSNAYGDGNFGAKTETVGASLVVYF